MNWAEEMKTGPSCQLTRNKSLETNWILPKLQIMTVSWFNIKAHFQFEFDSFCHGSGYDTCKWRIEKLLLMADVRDGVCWRSSYQFNNNCL